MCLGGGAWGTSSWEEIQDVLDGTRSLKDRGGQTDGQVRQMHIEQPWKCRMMKYSNNKFDNKIGGGDLTCTWFKLAVHEHGGLDKTHLPRHNKSSFYHQSSFICLPPGLERKRLRPNAPNSVLNFASLSTPTVSLPQPLAKHEQLISLLVGGRELHGTRAWVNPFEADNPSPTA